MTKVPVSLTIESAEKVALDNLNGPDKKDLLKRTSNYLSAIIRGKSKLEAVSEVVSNEVDELEALRSEVQQKEQELTKKQQYLDVLMKLNSDATARKAAIEQMQADEAEKKRLEEFRNSQTAKARALQLDEELRAVISEAVQGMPDDMAINDQTVFRLFGQTQGIEAKPEDWGLCGTHRKAPSFNEMRKELFDVAAGKMTFNAWKIKWGMMA